MADVMVVARRTQSRWELAAALEVPAASACAPDLAASRLAHPSGAPPDAVVLVVADRHDVVWLRQHAARTRRRPVPVVAIAAADLVAAARAAGVAAVVPRDATAVHLRQALELVTQPARVIDIGAARSA